MNGDGSDSGSGDSSTSATSNNGSRHATGGIRRGGAGQGAGGARGGASRAGGADIFPEDRHRLLPEPEPAILRLLSRLKPQERKESGGGGGDGGGSNTAAGNGGPADHVVVPILPARGRRATFQSVASGGGGGSGSGSGFGVGAQSPEDSMSPTERGHVAEALREHHAASSESLSAKFYSFQHFRMSNVSLTSAAMSGGAAAAPAVSSQLLRKAIYHCRLSESQDHYACLPQPAPLLGDKHEARFKPGFEFGEKDLIR